MTFELNCLAAMTIFFTVAWLPASLAKRFAYGRSYLLSNRDQVALPPLPAWADRSNRAYENLKSYFPAYAVAILVLAVEHRTDDAIQTAAALFLVARLVHFTSYTGGYVPGRAIAWVVGLGSNLYLLARAF